ncbi:MAG: biotin--[acetyl-CoA-carboxylase] ligase [Pseudomonadota bacterium]
MSRSDAGREHAWPAPGGARLLHLAETDSTNAEAARRAIAGEQGPLWIMADRQSAARARRGRSWSGGEGNLAASYLTATAMPPARAALVSFVAALAVADLCRLLAPRAEVTLKWPNDVLLNGGKVAGILLESASHAGRLDWIVVGIGVNLAAAPPPLDIRAGGTPPTSVIAEGGRKIAPDAALGLLAQALQRHLDRFMADGFEPIRADWLAQAERLGGRIGAGLATERLDGIFEDVDLSGALVLRTVSGGVRRVAAADIFFPD